MMGRVSNDGCWRWEDMLQRNQLVPDWMDIAGSQMKSSQCLLWFLSLHLLAVSVMAWIFLYFLLYFLPITCATRSQQLQFAAPPPTSPDCDWCSVLAVLADGDGCMLRMSKAHRVER